MSNDYTVKRIDEMESLFEGIFKRARAELGVSAFGLQILDLPANGRGLRHNETTTNQEEVYVTLSGSGTIRTDAEEELPLTPETLVRIGPNVTRQLIAGETGLRVLAIGGTLNGTYQPPSFTNLGGPVPGTK